MLLLEDQPRARDDWGGYEGDQDHPNHQLLKPAHLSHLIYSLPSSLQRIIGGFPGLNPVSSICLIPPEDQPSDLTNWTALAT